MNRELAKKVLAHLVTYPEHHRQEAWFMKEDWDHFGKIPKVEDFTSEKVISQCGTTACLAGWAAMLSDFDLTVRDGLSPIGYPVYSYSFVDKNGKVIDSGHETFSANRIGAVALELDEEDTHLLFLDLDEDAVVSVIFLMLELNTDRAYYAYSLATSRGKDLANLFDRLGVECPFDDLSAENLTDSEIFKELATLAKDGYELPKEGQLLLF